MGVTPRATLLGRPRAKLARPRARKMSMLMKATMAGRLSEYY